MRGRQALEAIRCGAEGCQELLPPLRHPKKQYCSFKCRDAERCKRSRTARGVPVVQCLECGKWYTKVGSHAVLAHGYVNAREYKIAFGLNYKKGVIPEEHKRQLAENVRANGTMENLKNGADKRFVKGDGRANKIMKQYWNYKRTGNYNESV